MVASCIPFAITLEFTLEMVFTYHIALLITFSIAFDFTFQIIVAVTVVVSALFCSKSLPPKAAYANPVHF